MDADNQIRFYAIRYIFRNVNFLHTNEDAKMLYRREKMVQRFKLYRETFNKNIALLKELDNFVAQPNPSPHKWLSTLETLGKKDIK